MHLAEARAPRDGGNFQAKLVAGHHRTAEARAIDGYEIEQLAFTIGNLVQEQDAAGLGQRVAAQLQV